MAERSTTTVAIVEKTKSVFVEQMDSIMLGGEVFLIVFISAILSTVARKSLCKLHEKLLHSKTRWDDAMVDAVRKPLVALIWLIGLTFAAQRINSASDKIALLETIMMVRKLGIIFIITWFLLGFVRKLEEHLFKTKVGTEIDRTTADAVGKLVRISIIITAALITLQTMGISISGLLAFGGVGGIVIGFAAKDLLSNFFGGLMVYMDRPFKVGDWVRSDQMPIEGTVEHIGWRLTRIRNFESRPLYVPNSIFTTISLENPSRMRYRRIKTDIGVRYDDFKQVSKIVDDIRKMLEERDDIAKDASLMVHFTEYGVSSLDINVYCFANTRDWATWRDIQQDVFIKIGEIVEAHKAEIAFPTQTLHLAKEGN
jgi:MscS family membrane protein